METLFAQIDATTDNTMHTNLLMRTLKNSLKHYNLHMSQILGIDDDRADEEGPKGY